jgi:hypothetical protein
MEKSMVICFACLPYNENGKDVDTEGKVWGK